MWDGRDRPLPHGCLAGLHLDFQVVPEFLDIILANLPGRQVDVLAGRNHALVASDQCRQDLDGLAAVLVGILHHRAVDLAIQDALQIGIFFIEAHDLDLTELAGLLDRRQALGRVVGEQPYHAAQVRILGDGVLGQSLGLAKVELIGAGVQHDILVPADRLAQLVAPGGIRRPAHDFIDHALPSYLGVHLLQTADEDDHRTAVRQCLLDQLASQPPGLVVVGAHVAQPIRPRGIAVLGDHGRVLAGLVDQLDLIRGIDRADRQTVDSAPHEVFDQPLLIGDALRRHHHVAADAELPFARLDPRRRHVPKRGNPIRNIRQANLGRFVGRLRQFAWNRTGPGFATSASQECSKQQGKPERATCIGLKHEEFISVWTGIWMAARKHRRSGRQANSPSSVQVDEVTKATDLRMSM